MGPNVNYPKYKLAYIIINAKSSKINENCKRLGGCFVVLYLPCFSLNCPKLIIIYLE